MLIQSVQNLFQFQHGAIKSYHSFTVNIRNFNFNSNMVRLKDGEKTFRIMIPYNFNSNMVRLKARRVMAGMFIY